MQYVGAAVFWEIGILSLQWSSKLTIGRLGVLVFILVPFEVTGVLEQQISSGFEFVNY